MTVNVLNSKKLKGNFPILVFLLLTSIAFNSFAEGTKQVSPTDQKISSLYFQPSSGFGSGFNALQRNRIYFHIANNATENLYFGANLRTGGSSSTLTDVYYKIKDAGGAVIVGPSLFTSNISSYAQAVAGPTSYAPITFDPIADGDYYIEIYRSSDGGVTGATSTFLSPWFDFSVGTSSSSITDGRVFCENWSFRATKPSDNFTGTFVDPVSPILYTYTTDETVVKVEFNDFQPLSFIPAFNHYGVNPAETDWSIGRRSINSNVSAPVLSGGYKTFLNAPDAAIYPVASLAAAPSLNGDVTGCAGAYFIPYLTNVDGDVRFLLDINGTVGFQLGTTDRILEAFAITAGSHLMPWDGLDGIGNVVSPNTTVTSQISMLRGRINLPLYDAEMNQNGFSLSAVSPVSVPNLTMYWDDASLTDHANNTTGAGVDNSALGQVSPGHGWNGTYGGTLLVPPVLPAGEGSDTPTDANDDFGNLRTINTWFWGLEEQSGTLNFRLPYCLSLEGAVYSDANGLNNSLIDGTGSNFGGLYAYLVNTSSDVVAIDTVNSDGTYIFNNIDSGSFTVRISTNTGIVGNPAPVIVFPTDYSTIGEGTAPTGDGTPSGDTPITVVASNISGINFGLNQRPNSNTATGTFLNPTGTNTETVPTLSGSDPEDGSLGATNSIIIKELPLNGTLYYNGIAVLDEQVIASYNPALLTFDPTFASVGIVVFDYAFLDNTGLVDLTPATVTINFTNNPPVANDGTNAPIASTAGQTAINALTATDTDGTIANYRIESLSALGTLYVGGVAVTIGQVLTPAQVATLTYDPAGTANGMDTFTFTAIDNDGAEDATDATISIPVTNNPPVANNDTNAPIASTAGQTAINALTATDTDGTIANYRIESLPSMGTLYVGGVAVTIGQVLTPAQVATLTYDPTGTANGTDTFTFTVIDNNGAEDVTDATISIPVANNPPVANNDTNAPIASTAGQTAINALTATDTDGAIANYRIESLPALGTLYVGGVAVTIGQVLTPAQVATLTYDPTGTANGTDTFTFTAIDNNGAEDAIDATISIPVTNNPPVANNDTNAPIASTAGQTAINALTATDTDGTIANYRIESLPALGTLYVGGVAVTIGQVLTPAQVATLTYDPTGMANGTDTFTFTAIDNNGAEDVTDATISIPVTNNPPVANDDTNAPIASTAGQTAINALTATDTDGTIANYRIESLPALGTLYVGGVAVTIGQVLTPVQVATLTYDPTGTANGTDTFTFTAIDNDGAEDVTDATISIPVTNNPPVANNDTNAPITSTAGQTAINALTATDTDGTIASYRIESLPIIGTLYVGGVAVTIGQVLTPAQVATLTYDPTGTANGTDTFTFTAIDNNGAEDATDATVSIPVTNNPPVANNDTNAPIASTAGQTAINALTATDTDGTIANYRIETLPTMGTLYVGGVAVTIGQVLTPAQVATLTYDPAGTANGMDTFTFTAIDNNGAEDVTDATISIPINNNPPVANNDTNAPIASTAGQTAINALTATDTDGTIANYRIESLPALGTLYVGGVAVTIGQVLTPAQVATLTYDPVGTANGTDTFTFTAIDNNGAEDATDATISIPVLGIPPVALDDADLYNVFGTNGLVNILANDTLSNGSLATTLNASIDINPSTPALDNTLIVGGEGTYTYNLSNGQVTFVPEIGLTGNPAPINYVLIDNNTGQKDTANIVITYSGFPNAVNDEDLNNLPGIVGVVNALSNDTLSTGVIANTINASIDLNPLTPSVDHILTIPGEGTYQYNLTTGIVTFIPDNGLVGNPTPINYNLIELTSGFTDMATISMTYLLPVVAVNDTNTTSPVGINVTFDIVSNDGLSNGDPATPAEVFVDINLTTLGDQDSLVVSGEGIWSYNSTTGEITFDPETGFVNDPTPISYIITEAMTGLLDTAIITILYETPPIANSDADLINQPQTSTVINLLTNDLLSNMSTATFSLVDVDLEPTAVGIQTSVLVPGEGNYVYNSANGNLTFTPAIGNYANPTPLIYSLIEKATGLSDTAIVTIQYQFSPSLELIKISTLMGSGVVGDSIQYDFTVINTGNVPVTGITITDTKISPTPITVSPSALAPGGTAVASRMYYLSPADIIAGEVLNSAIVNGTSSNAVAVKDTSDNGDPGMPGGSNPTRLLLPLSADVDVKLTGTIIGSCERVVGDIVTYQVKVFREDLSAGSVDIVVKDSLGVNFELVSQIASEGSFNIGTSRWSGISLASGDTATLTFQLRILTNIGGLTCVESWVDSLSRTDSDSNPGDRITTEDDIARACISVPISICTSKAETAELSTSLGYTSYQWYRNGTLISGATSSTYTATQGGSYTVIVNGSLCPNGSCCPIVVQENCPCPVEICLPISIRKSR